MLPLLLAATAAAQSLLPARVAATAPGVYADVPVTLERVVSTREPATTAWQVAAKQALARFGRLHVWSLPAGLQPEVAVYRVSGVDAHWVFHERSLASLTAGIAPLLETSPFGCSPFGPPFAAAPDLLNFTLETRRAGQVAAAAQALADVVGALGTADAGLWQPVTQRGCSLDEEGFNRLDHYAFEVDMTPFSGPDAESWLVVLRTGYSE